MTKATTAQVREARARAQVLQAVSKVPPEEVVSFLRRIADEIEGGTSGPVDHPRASDGRKYPVRVFLPGERRERVIAVIMSKPDGALSSEIMDAFNAKFNREERGRVYSTLHDLKNRFGILVQDPQTKRYQIKDDKREGLKAGIPQEGITVGVYHITPDPKAKDCYTLRNTFMGFSHSTYGTPEQVIESAKKQSTLWDAKKNSPKPPMPYPTKNVVDAKA